MQNPSICIFCGSATGADPRYSEVARRVGEELARQGLTLIYGGGRVGLMGILADAVLGAGGRAIGVIPEALATREVAHSGLTELRIVSGMHERKALMATLSTAFLTLPGGIGTFEEFFEILSWGALGIHQKPIGILNVAGYFDPLVALLEHGIAAQFIRDAYLQPLLVSDNLEGLIADLLKYQPSRAAPRWINLEET
jgi:uncharacterized protein (TIGR00730 family)